MNIYITVVICCAVFALWKTIHSAGASRAVFPSAVTGVLALAALNGSSIAGGAALTMNLFNVSVCAVFGIPGLISLMLLKIICVI